MKILVTGAAGMLGTSLLPVLKDCGHSVLATDINFISDSIRYLDVRNGDEMLSMAQDFRPDILFHLAAETNLEVCEKRVDFAYEENFLGTEHACVVCRDLDIPLVYVSTAGVFDGTKDGPYTEFDQPNPINVYGQSKYQGEQIVRETLPQHYIVRAGWMIGGGERDKKFVHRMIERLNQDAKIIHAVTDKIGTPTYAPAFSTVLERLVRTKHYGTYHLACKGRASRYDVAAKMLEILGRNDVRLEAVKSDFFKTEFFAPRPRSEELRNYVLELMAMDEMPHWIGSLEEYLKIHFRDQFR